MKDELKDEKNDGKKPRSSDANPPHSPKTDA